jgi:transcriptional regulator with XRE-family HTH domain
MSEAEGSDADLPPEVACKEITGSSCASLGHQYSNECYICCMDRPNILRDVMSRSGMSQSRLSVLSGVKQPSLSQMMHGRIDMSDDMLDRLLSCMGYRLEVVRRPVPATLDRSSRRRWRMHQPLVSQLSPDSLRHWGPVLTRNLERLRRSTRGEPHMRNIDRWSELVSSGDVREIRRLMTGLDTDSIQMREVSPFGGLLPEDQRQRVLAELQR